MNNAFRDNVSSPAPMFMYSPFLEPTIRRNNSLTLISVSSVPTDSVPAQPPHPGLATTTTTTTLSQTSTTRESESDDIDIFTPATTTTATGKLSTVKLVPPLPKDPLQMTVQELIDHYVASTGPSGAKIRAVRSASSVITTTTTTTHRPLTHDQVRRAAFIPATVKPPSPGDSQRSDVTEKLEESEGDGEKKSYVEDEEFYSVERIVSHRGPRNNREYKVRWEGYSSKDDSWLAATDFARKDMMDEYERQLTQKLKRREPPTCDNTTPITTRSRRARLAKRSN